jgi:hypothetical protein
MQLLDDFLGGLGELAGPWRDEKADNAGDILGLLGHALDGNGAEPIQDEATDESYDQGHPQQSPKNSSFDFHARPVGSLLFLVE